MSTRCGEKYDSHWVANNTLVELPFYCSAFLPGKIFLHPILMKRRKKEEPADSMLQRQAKAPALSIRISKNKLREKTNATVAHWQAVESDLQQHLEDHLEKKTTIWDNLRWEVIAILVAIVIGTTGLLLAAKKVWNSWTSTFTPPPAQSTASSTFRSYYDTSPPHNMDQHSTGWDGKH